MASAPNERPFGLSLHRLSTVPGLALAALRVGQWEAQGNWPDAQVAVMVTGAG